MESENPDATSLGMVHLHYRMHFRIRSILFYEVTDTIFKQKPCSLTPRRLHSTCISGQPRSMLPTLTSSSLTPSSSAFSRSSNPYPLSKISTSTCPTLSLGRTANWETTLMNQTKISSSTMKRMKRSSTYSTTPREGRRRNRGWSSTNFKIY
jgi:hypothetical protein